ncbi:MAG: type II toxin-antitoxin system RelE/ParE family toxin [Magnetococcales bacterium]|nr:type II toxin-antitoxin system RelE/ParE family toxin [Magnetococcales bacterium]
MNWTVVFHDAFYADQLRFTRDVQTELLANLRLLEQVGPQLSRPYADTLKGSKYDNMKELRFRVGGGEWRVAFAFDPNRQAILLVAGNKTGTKQKLFYRKLIETADRRFAEHLAQQGKEC